MFLHTADSAFAMFTLRVVVRIYFHAPLDPHTTSIVLCNGLVFVEA